jgi:hypothetical protein
LPLLTNLGRIVLLTHLRPYQNAIGR